MRRYTYGPVLSRRLGRSLGIDLVPYKTCTFDCVYCQLGRTTNKTVERREYLPVRSILREIEEFSWERIDYITLAGSGEPTLNSKIGGVIEGIK
ncbi:MAG: radical SAM protein [Candidatus Syntrophoarchaeum sp. WYZ-LMO15]|nr:MAG: radical SAM protein [Candidatus Syntrophoarchaeum sp. WYZ-LMO15]